MYKQRSIRLTEERDTKIGKIAKKLGTTKQNVMNLAFDKLIDSESPTKDVVDAELESLIFEASLLSEDKRKATVDAIKYLIKAAKL